MREIKFRAKRVDIGDWMHGYLREVFGYKKRVFMISPAQTFEEDGITDVHEDYVQSDTIGQFTGLTDKNGTPIYEGDIVLQQGYHGKKTPMVVRFECSAFIVGYHEGSSTKSRPMLLNSKCEVIGNIFDNKDLLED